MSGIQQEVVGFTIEKWHSLTETTPPGAPDTVREVNTVTAKTLAPEAATDGDLRPAVAGLGPDLTRLLHDILVYMYASVRTRIKRLSISVRVFEKAKLEGCEKGFIFESAAGATTYLIPLAKTFETFGFPCPYERAASVEHAFYVGWGQHLLQQDPAHRRVLTESRLGESGCTSDLVTVAHTGVRRAYEITLSTGNVLSNAAKYAGTDFVQIVFLCRDYQLRDAAKACCREGGLSADLLARLEFMQFSSLARRQRSSSS